MLYRRSRLIVRRIAESRTLLGGSLPQLSLSARIPHSDTQIFRGRDLLEFLAPRAEVLEHSRVP